MTHGSFFLARESLLILFITIQKEDGIIHRYTKLQDCCQCLCDIRSFTKYNITSKVIQNRKSDT